MFIYIDGTSLSNFKFQTYISGSAIKRDIALLEKIKSKKIRSVPKKKLPTVEWSIISPKSINITIIDIV
jgi:hypothetical protein